MKQSLMAVNHKFLTQWSSVGGATFLLPSDLCSGKDDSQKLPESNKVNVWILHL